MSNKTTDSRKNGIKEDFPGKKTTVNAEEKELLERPECAT